MKIRCKTGKIRILPESNWLSLAMLAGLFVEALFLLLVLALDVLPFQYILAILITLFVIDATIVVLLNNKSRGSLQRIVGLIVVVVVIHVLLFGNVYVYSTYDTLQKISRQKATWEIYNVMALKEGSYNDIEDADGKTLSVVDMDSKQLTEAKERLVTGYDVSYDSKSNMLDVGRKLVGDDGKTHDNLILVTSDNRKLINQQIKGFQEKTKVIYSMKVKKRTDDNAKRIDVTEESFNVLISGKDVWGKLKSTKSGLSDVNMVMTVNPKTKEVLLTSIPRDSYVTLHSYGAKDKLTHTGIFGEEETKQTIEDFLDIDINYEIAVNFSMLVDIINAIDGIDVYSDYDFKSAIAEYEYTKGWNHLTGRPALYFARERKAFFEGDMQRNKNQQKVLKATIEKVTSSKVLMTRYAGLLNAVEDKMYTNLSDRDIKKLARLTLKHMGRKWTVKTVNISGGTGMAPCYSMGGQNLSCVFPSEDTVLEAKEAIHDTMYPVDNTIKKNQKDEKTETGHTETEE